MNKVEHVSKSFKNVTVFADLTLEIPDREITVILGPSGCGKTTLLNILAGLARPDRGEVAVSGEVSYLFQDSRLLPWLTVRKNVTLVLRERMKPAAAAGTADYYLEAAGIAAYADFYPAQLSGGLRQRVALARAFAYPAPLLLMDEPFKSLDIKIRFKLIRDFIELWRREPRTVVTVTHDLKEGIYLGDRIVILTDKPSAVARTVTIPQPQEERMGNRDLLLLEEELFRVLLD